MARWLPEFPIRERCLYLDHAAVSPLPRPVADAMRRRVTEQESAGALVREQWLQSELAVRTLAADLLACRPADVSIVRSTSEGLSLIAQGLSWRPSDRVLVGTEEPAANVAPYLALARWGVVVHRFPTPSGRVLAETVEPLLRPPTKLVALSWVAFHTGWVAEVELIARLARERGVIVVLDALQGLGVLPSTLAELGVDALVSDGHTWLLGPEGAGIMVTTEALRARLQPVLAGWHNVDRAATEFFLDRLEFHRDGRRFEPGSPPTGLIAGLEAALNLLLEVGIEEVHRRVSSHTRSLTNDLLQAGWNVASPGSSHPIAGIVAARHPVLPADEVARRLRQRSVEVSARQGLVRFSPHFYTTAGELEALRVILRKL